MDRRLQIKYPGEKQRGFTFRRSIDLKMLCWLLGFTAIKLSCEFILMMIVCQNISRSEYRA